jgi:endonuclease IV
MNVGAHLSKRKSILQTLEYAFENGLPTFQFYIASPRGYKVQIPPMQDIIDSRALIKKKSSALNTNVVVHGCLLYNLCSSKEDQLEKTVNGLQLELDIVAGFGGKGVVVHPGSHPNREYGLKKIAESITEVLSSYSSTTQQIADSLNISVNELCEQRMIILENCAGEGNKLAKDLDELHTIIEYIPEKLRKHVGVCIDTAHLHSAGDWDISCEMGIYAFFNAFEHILGWDRLTLVHLNDSKVPFDCKRDRHEAIGDGTIFKDRDVFVEILTRCSDIPMIMELPVPSEPYIMLARLLMNVK